MSNDEPWTGIPLGGMGTESIGRTCHGDFNGWPLDLGFCRFESIVPNQFSVHVEHADLPQAHVLSPLPLGR